MKIEFVTVCVNYLDYFYHAYKHNRTQIDNMIVVTDNKDTLTPKFCENNGIDFVQTDIFYQNGKPFDKGAAINEGFKRLKYKDWVCYIDADTFVSSLFRHDMEIMQRTGFLRPEYFFGAERVVLKTAQDYKDYLQNNNFDKFEYPEGFGYGYFQLFNWQSSVIQRLKPGTWYPSFPNARESDWQFRSYWGDFDGSHKNWKGNLERLPFKVLNLGEHGKNHFGRVTQEFVVDNS